MSWRQVPDEILNYALSSIVTPVGILTKEMCFSCIFSGVQLLVPVLHLYKRTGPENWELQASNDMQKGSWTHLTIILWWSWTNLVSNCNMFKSMKLSQLLVMICGWGGRIGCLCNSLALLVERTTGHGEDAVWKLPCLDRWRLDRLDSKKNAERSDNGIKHVESPWIWHF